MTTIEKLAFIYRCNLLIENLKNCNSGAEVHQVGNMKQTAQGILDVIADEKDSDCSHEQIEAILGRLEQQEVTFFKKKFEYLKSTQTQTLDTSHNDTNTTTQTQTQTSTPKIQNK